MAQIINGMSEILVMKVAIGASRCTHEVVTSCVSILALFKTQKNAPNNRARFFVYLMKSLGV
ncbi:hypothetical protein GCM10008927_00150 [Amylibacter ulvae]|uniref:Uncharacterized protein n=1 Tax=Paramylibacter ulvae TaxID=1651968 RepID=A0ABQ3CUU1_9RHOB|nr:hypothetical protein GCM10008927_00150 [Amylibacter ulvae]